MCRASHSCRFLRVDGYVNDSIDHGHPEGDNSDPSTAVNAQARAQSSAPAENAGQVRTQIYMATTVTECDGNRRPLETCTDRTLTACIESEPLNCCTDGPVGIILPVARVTELEPRLTKISLSHPDATVTLIPLTDFTDPSNTGSFAMLSTVIPVAPVIA